MSESKTVDGGRKIYDFAPVFYFWIGASILSMVLAATAWNVKPREKFFATAHPHHECRTEIPDTSLDRDPRERG